MQTLPTPPEERRPGERRKEPRQSVLFRTVMIDSEIEGETAEIVNIARSGFLARTSIERDHGSRVEIALPVLGGLEATVVWCGNGMLGGRFARPIEEAAFAAMLNDLA